jgi:hypothetical protein
LPKRAAGGETARVIANVVIHLANDLPVLVDLYEMPGPTDLSVRCTNVRTVDGKRPSFVHNSRSTFVFPFSIIRMIEARGGPVTDTTMVTVDEVASDLPPEAPVDEEPDEDLLARIRSV